MTGILYLAWRYLAFHRVKTTILVTSITLILYLPVGLRVLVDQSSFQLTSRAEATPLIVGTRGSPLELVLNTLYYRADYPGVMSYAEASRVEDSGLARAIPVYVRFRARGYPIVGTTLDYFAFRNLRMAAGRSLTILGDCVLGSRVAAALELEPGDEIISSPESVFDLAGVYPLKMRVAGVLDVELEVLGVIVVAGINRRRMRAERLMDHGLDTVRRDDGPRRLLAHQVR